MEERILNEAQSGEEEHNPYEQINFLMFLILTWAYVYIGGWMESKHFTWIHITGLGIIIGFTIGMIFHYASGGEYDYSNVGFNEEFFFHFLLPPIIFAGGYNLQTRRFFYCFYYIFLYGFVGTIITFMVTAGFTYLFTGLDLLKVQQYNVVHLDHTDVLLYSATTSATDAIAALSMMDSTKYAKLFSVLFGEGMVNDAVSIIIYTTVYKLTVVPEGETMTFEWYTVFNIIGDFLLVVFGSLGIGIVFGIISAIVTKYGRFLSHHPVLEVTTVFMLGYIGYIISEGLHLSGVLTVLVTGVFMNAYTSKNLSMTGKVSSKVTLEFMAMAAEGFIYIYLGISCWYYEGPMNSSSDDYDRPWSWQFLLYELVVTFFSRFCGIFVVSWVAILFKGKKNWSLNRYEMGIIYFAGVIRGSIAYALIQNLPGNNIGQEIIKATVYFIVVITTLALGSFIPIWITFSLKRIETNKKRYTANHPSMYDPLEDKQLDEQELDTIDCEDTEPEINKPDEQDEANKKYKNKFKKIEQWFLNLDEKKLSPWFIHDYHTEKLNLEQETKVIDMVIQKKQLRSKKSSIIGDDRLFAKNSVRSQSIDINNRLKNNITTINENKKKQQLQKQKISSKSLANLSHLNDDQKNQNNDLQQGLLINDNYIQIENNNKLKNQQKISGVSIESYNSDGEESNNIQ